VEIGPGRVLQGLLKRIEPNCTCVSVGCPAEVQAFADTAEKELC
jgi:hypothetical protein